MSARPGLPACFAVFLPYALLALVLLSGCEGPFVALPKAPVPADHTDRQGGARHMPNPEKPFASKSGCDSSDCHQADLRGGLGRLDGQAVRVSSCYQCHPKNWSGSAPPPASVLPSPVSAH